MCHSINQGREGRMQEFFTGMGKLMDHGMVLAAQKHLFEVERSRIATYDRMFKDENLRRKLIGLVGLLRLGNFRIVRRSCKKVCSQKSQNIAVKFMWAA